MKQWIMACVLALGLSLSACQTLPAASERNSVVVDKTMVHSFHLGRNAAAKSYLLIVLNDKGTQTMEATAAKGQPFDIVLDGHRYEQSAQVNTGFLVLNPAAGEWDQSSLNQLLK